MTIAWMLTDTFSGIAPADAPAFKRGQADPSGRSAHHG